jgi:hypothetical protein
LWFNDHRNGAVPRQSGDGRAKANYLRSHKRLQKHDLYTP